MAHVLSPPPGSGSPIQLIRGWVYRHFSDPQVLGLAIVLVVAVAIVLFAGKMVAPVIGSVVIAYLLEGMVGFLNTRGLRRLVAVSIVFSVFMVGLLFGIFALLPLLTEQTVQLIRLLPNMIYKGQVLLLTLPEQYPELEKEILDISAQIRSEAISFGQLLVTRSVSSVVGVITIVVYLVLMPIMVFFFLKDKERIVSWIASVLPDDRRMLKRVWYDVDLQIHNYVRGKFVEILIVWVASYVAFALMGLEFAMLLGIAVGLSVVIPYIGAMVVTLPVAMVAYFQWGFAPEFFWLMIAYLAIQLVDGNVLVPLIFSEAVNLHPIAIILAIFIFGGLWGFWGVFFAIPLATLVSAVLKAWPRFYRIDHEDQPVEAPGS